LPSFMQEHVNDRALQKGITIYEILPDDSDDP
jgi:hypothetical protein